GASEEVADALDSEHVGNLVRIADNRGDAVRQDAALEFVGRHQRGFDVQVGVDEAGYDDAVVALDQGRAIVVAVGADDPVGDDGDVGMGEPTGNDVQQP